MDSRKTKDKFHYTVWPWKAIYCDGVSPATYANALIPKVIDRMTTCSGKPHDNCYACGLLICGCPAAVACLPIAITLSCCGLFRDGGRHIKEECSQPSSEAGPLKQVMK